MEWEEKVTNLSGLTASIICQKLEFIAITRVKAGASQMLLWKRGNG